MFNSSSLNNIKLTMMQLQERKLSGFKVIQLIFCQILEAHKNKITRYVEAEASSLCLFAEAILMSQNECENGFLKS